MTLFKSDGQFILIPCIGFVRDVRSVYLNISWLWFGVVFRLFDIYHTNENGR